MFSGIISSFILPFNLFVDCVLSIFGHFRVSVGHQHVNICCARCCCATFLPFKYSDWPDGSCSYSGIQISVDGTVRQSTAASPTSTPTSSLLERWRYHFAGLQR